MKSTSRMFNALLGGIVLGFALAPHAIAQAPTLASATFYGGAGDQRGTAIAVSDGVYVSGNVQPETGDSSAAALVLKYGLPSGPSPVWARSYGFGTNFFGIAATNEGVYADGSNYSLTTDNVGGKEAKTFLAKFAGDGSSGGGPGGAIWVTGGPGNLGPFFSYSGVEVFSAATSQMESGSTFVYAAGSGQPCSYSAYIVAKYATSGNFIAAATDSSVGINFASCFIPSNGFSATPGVTTLNGNVYLAGFTAWASEGDSPGRPAVWKYNPSLSLVWRRKDATLAGSLNATTGFGGAIYAVGYTYTPGSPSSEDYLIQKYDEAGNLLWSQTSGGANTDVLTGVVAIGTRLFAVGYTKSSGAGGADSVVLEIDPATGATLSTTLFGGALDDKANGAATDGTDLYVVGESRSFASAEGNVVGQNDVMLLRYTLNNLCQNVVCTASDQCHVAGTCDPSTGTCSNPAKANGTVCNDGNACTQTDTCQNGTCTGSNPVTCTASDQCHNAGTCDPSTGTCSNPAKANGSVCNDGNACTQTDTCQNGTCTGSNPVTCTASDQCHVAGVCDPTTGACSNPTATNGTSCNDNNACSSDETCQSGVCTNSCGLTGPQDACSAAQFTGGGQFNGPDTWSFGFNAKGAVSGTASGHFNAVDHNNGAQISGDVTSITCFNATTSTMTFDVTDGSCTYQVTVHDGGEPGAGNDSITITNTSGGSCPAGGGGTLSAGNIQSH